jgi:hypothetical protein
MKKYAPKKENIKKLEIYLKKLYGDDKNRELNGKDNQPNSKR